MGEIITGFSVQDKLEILADAAKYDVACTSSGVDRKGSKGMLGNSKACGICHSFAADGRCISLLKILMTNHCAYDCKYCVNRASNDVPRATFTPEEICELTMEFYKRNYIEGLFLSSGVLKNPTYTMEKMCETLLLLRNKYHFNGYIHIKTIPGASDDMLATAGYLADRISVNLELPTKESLEKLAPNKSFKTIIDPMSKVSDTIAAHRMAIGKNPYMERSAGNKYLSNSIFASDNRYSSGIYNIGGAGTKGTIIEDSTQKTNDNIAVNNTNMMSGDNSSSSSSFGGNVINNLDIADNKLHISSHKYELAPTDMGKLKRSFAPAGQSTQMIIGATPETDLTLIKTSESLYRQYDLKRVFYSAYIPINEDSVLPELGTAPPLLREHRLYQADWLLRYYGFNSGELLSEEKPNFNEKLDPKCDWALRHLGDFPVEVQTASYETLLRVPGIGPKSAGRIMSTRRYCKLDFTSLKKIGVVLKRAHYFITCNGKMMYNTPIEEQFITRQLVDVGKKENWQVANQNQSYQQMSLFDYGIG